MGGKFQYDVASDLVMTFLSEVSMCYTYVGRLILF